MLKVVSEQERKYTNDQIKAFEILQRLGFIMKLKRKQAKSSALRCEWLLRCEAVGAISIALCVGVANGGRAKKWVSRNQKILYYL